MNDGFRYNFPPCFMTDFLAACQYYEIPEHLHEMVLDQIDYALYDAYFVNPDLEGDERAREFVAEAFNEINREWGLGYPELPMSEHTWFPDDSYYIPPDFHTRPDDWDLR